MIVVLNDKPLEMLSRLTITKSVEKKEGFNRIEIVSK
jgi:hypothetical protein